MATMLPQQHPPPSSRPSHDFAPSSPPDRVMFQQPQRDNSIGPPLHYRSSIEFRRTSGPGFADTGGGLPPPHGPQPMPNGGSRHRGTMSLGAFEGGKSPPGTKSRLAWILFDEVITDLYSQILRTFLANSSGPASVKRDLLARSHTLLTSRLRIRLANTSPRYVQQHATGQKTPSSLTQYRVIVSSDRSVPLLTFYRTEGLSIDQMV